MMLSLQVGNGVVPNQTSQLFLSSSGGPMSSFIACPLALCTRAPHAQVGQEGIGKADQVQGCHGGPIMPILILAQPQELLTVLQELFHGPTFCIRLNQSSGRQVRIVRDESEDLLFGAFAREDRVQQAKRTHLEPASIDEAVAGLPMWLCKHEHRGRTSPKQVPDIA